MNEPTGVLNTAPICETGHTIMLWPYYIRGREGGETVVFGAVTGFETSVSRRSPPRGSKVVSVTLNKLGLCIGTCTAAAVPHRRARGARKCATVGRPNRTMALDHVVALDLHAADDRCHVQLTIRRLQTCPICFELSDDMIQLPHPFANSSADVSGHKLCVRCVDRWPGDCPFCRSAPLPPPPHGFKGIWRCSASSSMEDVAAQAVPPEDAPHVRRRRSLWSLLPKLHRSSGTHMLTQQARPPRPQPPCRGCRHGCMECDPSGLLIDPDAWPGRSTGLY